MSGRKLSWKLSKPSGVKIATQGSSHFARTRPPENEARNFAGIVSRFFASSEYSKWPLNAMKFDSAGVAEWEEHRDSGLLRAAIVPHSLPLCNLFPHLSDSGVLNSA